MDTHSMDAHSDRLSDYLDGTMELSARAELERHLASCAGCSQTLLELHRVKDRAAQLVDREPAVDLWRFVAAGMAAAPRSANIDSARGNARQDAVPRYDARAVGRARRRTFSFSAAQLLAASLALVALSGTSAWLLGRARNIPAVTASAEPAARVDSVAVVGAKQRGDAALVGPQRGEAMLVAAPSDRALGITAYDSAVADLRLVLDAGRGRLKPQTIRVLEKNLAAIDRAIADARRALGSDPESAPFLGSYLQQQMKRKLDLMKRAAAIASAAD